MDQGSNKNHSPAYNFTPTVTKFCVMWEGLSLPHDTKFGNCRCKIVDSRSFHSWSLIHGLRWSGLIKVGPENFEQFKAVPINHDHQGCSLRHTPPPLHITIREHSIIVLSSYTQTWWRPYPCVLVIWIWLMHLCFFYIRFGSTLLLCYLHIHRHDDVHIHAYS